MSHASSAGAGLFCKTSFTPGRGQAIVLSGITPMEYTLIGIHRLLAAIVERAVKDTRRGDQKARSWLLDTGSIWVDTLLDQDPEAWRAWVERGCPLPAEGNGKGEAVERMTWAEERYFCKTCGEPTKPGRRYCDRCRPKQWWRKDQRERDAALEARAEKGTH